MAELNLFETWPVVKKQRVDSTSSLYHYQEKSAEIIEINEDSDIDEMDRLDKDGDDDDENEELCEGQGASVTQSTNIVCDKELSKSRRMCELVFAWTFTWLALCMHACMRGVCL